MRWGGYKERLTYFFLENVALGDDFLDNLPVPAVLLLVDSELGLFPLIRNRLRDLGLLLLDFLIHNFLRLVQNYHQLFLIS